jgi:hypothetical protein
LLHRTPHRVVLKCLLVLLSQDTYQFRHVTISIPCCNRRAARTKRKNLELSFMFPTLFLILRDGYVTRMFTYTHFGFHRWGRRWNEGS